MGHAHRVLVALLTGIIVAGRKQLLRCWGCLAAITRAASFATRGIAADQQKDQVDSKADVADVALPGASCC